MQNLNICLKVQYKNLDKENYLPKYTANLLCFQFVNHSKLFRNFLYEKDAGLTKYLWGLKN